MIIKMFFTSIRIVLMIIKMFFIAIRFILMIIKMFFIAIRLFLVFSKKNFSFTRTRMTQICNADFLLKCLAVPNCLARFDVGATPFKIQTKVLRKNNRSVFCFYKNICYFYKSIFYAFFQGNGAYHIRK